MNSSKGLPLKLLAAIITLILLAGLSFYTYKHHDAIWETFTHHGATIVPLPAPVYQSAVSIEQTLKGRRSVRNYKPDALTLPQLSQLLWAAQGITTAKGNRTAPSAGALYPLEIYVVSGNIDNLPAGVYHYLPAQHSLELLISGDKRKEVATTVSEPKDVAVAPLQILITANPTKTVAKYGSRGQRFVYLEAGQATENLLLQAVGLGLSAVNIGGFEENALQMLLNLPKDEEAIYVVPVSKS